MNTRKLKVKISVFLIFMLIFWLSGSSFIYASDTGPASDNEEPPAFAGNLLHAVRSFVDNIRSLFGINDTEATGEDGEEESEDEVEGEEDPGNRHNFGEEISDIARGLETGDSTVDELVEKATSIHLKVLEEVYEKVPQTAKEAILRAMENSMKGNAAARDALKNKGASESDDEDGEDEEEEGGPEGRGRDNASDMGKKMRDNNPSNR